MKCSFQYEFEPFGYFRDPIIHADENHKENWLKLRRYEYYTEHKTSVDKYGKVTPDMQLHGEELAQLKTIVAQQNREREIVLKEWRERSIYKLDSKDDDNQENE